MIESKCKGIYLLFNLLIIVGLFLGFFVVVFLMNGKFEVVVVVVFVVMIFDGLDGRVVWIINI